MMKYETVAVKYTENGAEPMSFGELLDANHVIISDLADCCCISRQMIYRYIKGQVRPERLTYSNVTDIAQYLDETDLVVYNSLCESFERVHVYNEESGKWE